MPALLIDTEADLRDQLEHILAAMLRIEQEEHGTLAAVDPRYRASARNLLHFIAFQRHRHPGLELALRQCGLSTLAGCDPHLLHTLTAVLGWLRPGPASVGSPDGPDRQQGERLLQHHCDRLFGLGGSQGGTSIMVTLPAAAAQQPGMIRDLVQAGMGLARINCAHDDPATWRALVAGVRDACVATGRDCRIAIDLAGPKLRTCGLPPLEGVIDGRPQRDRLGRLIRPFRLLVTHDGPAPANLPADVVVLPVQGEGLEGLQRGDRLRGRDASGRWRELVVLDTAADGIGMSCNQRCRFIRGLRFQQEGGSAWLEVAELPAAPGELLLRQGDELRLTATPTGEPDAVACSLPEVFASLREGERVLFDEGRIEAVIHSLSSEELGLTITHARPRGSRLRNDKGINFPDSTLALPALTAKDLDDLTFATEHADLLSCSFVHSEADIEALQLALRRAGREDLPLVLRIETRRGFLDLPRQLLAAMRRPAPVGVMIARDDLAIECGWEALAEIQEEILRICAAAHVPCIWATRGEVVMLNKGPTITATVRTLREIVGRMRSNCGAVEEESLVP